MTTRFLIVPVAAIAFLLIGAPYAAAVAQSPRSALMPETIAACREQALSLEKLMALMALNGVSVNEVCESQSSLFISKLDDFLGAPTKSRRVLVKGCRRHAWASFHANTKLLRDNIGSCAISGTNSPLGAMKRIKRVTKGAASTLPRGNGPTIRPRDSCSGVAQAARLFPLWEPRFRYGRDRRTALEDGFGASGLA
jgi:hypothetical protein